MVATRRDKIITALVDLFIPIDGTGSFSSNLYENITSKLVFWDEVTDYPTVSVVSGNETREYLPGGFKWGFLIVNIRIYVKDEDAKTRLEEIFEDIEIVLDANNTLILSDGTRCTDVRILSITDDEGLLNPIGVGEIVVQVQYQV